MASKNNIGGGFTGSELRAMRAKNGVGRPPAIMLARLKRLGWHARTTVVTTKLLDGVTIERGVVLWYREPGSKVGPAERRRRRRAKAHMAGLLNFAGNLQVSRMNMVKVRGGIVGGVVT